MSENGDDLQADAKAVPDSPVTLGTALPKEMARVRDQVMPPYLEIGPAGAFALAFMRRDLDRAAKAMAEGDVIEMMRAYQSLKEYTA